MESAGDKFRNFAVAFWRTAEKDLERAEDALEEKYYSYAVFHSQQCVEKSIKALLEMEKVVVRDHDISDMFTLYILKKEEDKDVKKNLYEILDILDWFKGTWILSRYPIMKKGRVISPFEQYDKEDAKFAVDKAQFVFNFLEKIITDKYGLEKEDERINKDK